jgi:hypothetical protein
MQKRIIGLQIRQSVEQGQRLQNALTKYGCAIRTRIGLNKDDKGIDEGIILLEIAAEEDLQEIENLKYTLQNIEGVVLREMVFE